MSDFSGWIGKPTGAHVVSIERGPVSNFATALTDESAVYHDAGAARDAGFDNIPAPPTYPFAMQHWGAFDEDQPDDPTEGVNPMAEVLGELMAGGGLILDGEQEFEFHKALVVGQRLHHRGEVKDIYSKESKGKTMTFMVVEDRYTDDKGEPVVTSTMNLIHRA